MGVVSLTQCRFGIFSPKNRFSSADSTVNSAATTRARAVCAAPAGLTTATHMPHSAAGTAVSSRCILSLARSTCHAVTGRDWASHRLFPSRDTEGAAISFMPTRVHNAAHSSTDRAPGLPANTGSSIGRKLPPFHTSAPAPMTIPRMPMPQLSI